MVIVSLNLVHWICGCSYSTTLKAKLSLLGHLFQETSFEKLNLSAHLGHQIL